MAKTGAVLTEYDRATTAWLKVEAFLKNRLARLRERNDADLDERKTARLRGSIAEVKGLLTLANDEPELPDEDEFKD